jgi:hypothetical protein
MQRAHHCANVACLVTPVTTERQSTIMNLTSSHPFWSVNNGLPADYPSLQRDAHLFRFGR